jgi:hypothetical protein
MKLMNKSRKPASRASHEAKKKTSVLSCVQQTAEWLEMYTRILRDLRQAPSVH